MSATQAAKDRFADYVPVSERLEQFYSDHPEGRILTSIVEHDAENGFVLIRAEAYRNPEDSVPSATGHAFENRSEGYVNKTSYIENCETSATGRALAMLGYEIKRGIASREEMQKTDRMKDEPSPTAELCPGCGESKAVIKSKPEYGGGFVCFKKKGGCGAKWGGDAKSADISLRNELIEQADRLLAAQGHPEEKRKNALGRLARLSTEDMQVKVNELTDQAAHARTTSKIDDRKAEVIAAIKKELPADAVEKELKKNWRGARLEDLEVDALETILTDLIPF